MNCKYCNEPLAKNAAVCKRCGRYLGEEQERKPSRGRRKIGIVAGMAAIAVIFILTTFGSSFIHQQATNGQLERQAAAASENHLGMTLEKFKDAFNDAAYAKQAGLAIGNIEIVAGSKENAFQYAFSDKLTISGEIGKADHQLLSVKITQIPSAKKDDLLRWSAAIGVVIDTFSADVPESGRKEILNQLGFYSGADAAKLNETAEINGKKYHFAFVDQAGFVLTLTNANRRT